MWSTLLTDILELIVTSKTLTVLDVFSFAAVCRSWRSAAAAASKHRRRRHIPWLFFVDKEDPNSAKFYDLSKNKIVSIPNQPIPSFAHRIFIGSAHGWLIAADEKSELSLVNPLTRQQIDLPPVTPISDYVLPEETGSDGSITEYSLKVGSGTYRFSAETLSYALYERASLLMAADSGDYLVAVYLCNSCLAVARSGDKKWSVVKERKHITDIAFHDDGKLYTASDDGVVNSWDFHAREQEEDLSSVKPELVSCKEMKRDNVIDTYYILRSPAGELLLVHRDRYFEDDEHEFFVPSDELMPTMKIKVWRIDCNDGNGSKSSKLVRLRSLGDYAIFLGSVMSTCVSSKDYPDLRGNCAYLFDDEFEGHMDGLHCWRQDVGIFEFKDGSFEPILPPDTNLYLSSPMWFIPTFA